MRITTTVNGETHEVDDVWEGESLLYVLRERMGRPGSKNACEQGECGSCTVYIDGIPACACLVAAGQAIGREIITIEGISADEKLHPVQQAFIETGAVQCGFCTPGLLVATHDLLQRDPEPDGTEYRRGHVVIDGPRITAVNEGAAPRDLPGATYVDAIGCLDEEAVAHEVKVTSAALLARAGVTS